MWLLLSTIGLGLMMAAWNAAPREPQMAVVLTIVAGLLLLLSLCFGSLTVADAGDRLRIQYGPLPLFGRSILYSQIGAVEAGRSRLIDGWGIHWIPGRGWTYNLWGFDCVVVHLGSRLIRIGTDDRDGLLELLESQLQS